MDLALPIDSIEHTFYRNKYILFNIELGVIMYKSTAYCHKIKRFGHYPLAKIKGIQNLLKEKNIQLSGVYNYDEEFIGDKNQDYVRLTLIDANTLVIINHLKIPKEMFDPYFIEIFLKYSLKDLSVYSDPTRPNPRHPLLLPDLKKFVIVTDGDKAYPKILEKLGVKQHRCVFHKVMNQRLVTWKQQRRIGRKQKSFKSKKAKKH